MSSKMKIVLIVVIALMAGLGFAATNIVFQQNNQLRILQDQVSKLRWNAEWYKGFANATLQSTEQEGLQMVSEQIAPNTLWAAIPSPNTRGIAQYLIDTDTGAPHLVNSFSSNQPRGEKVWFVSMTTSTEGGVFHVSWEGYAPQQVDDYYSTATGKQLLSWWNEWDGLAVHISNGKQEITLMPDVSCSPFDRPNDPFNATGTIKGVLVDKTPIPLSESISQDCIANEGEGAGPPVHFFDQSRSFEYDPQKNILSIPTIFGYVVSVDVSNLTSHGVHIEGAYFEGGGS